MNGREHNAYLGTIEAMRAEIVLAQRFRDKRREVVDGQPAWIAYEIDNATDAVNRLRARLGKGPVARPLVERLEALAQPDTTSEAIYSVETPETFAKEPFFAWRAWVFEGRRTFASEQEARETAEDYCANRFRVVKHTRGVVYEEPRVGR